MSIYITKREANEVAEEITNQISKKIKDDAEEVKTAYNIIVGDWGGAAAKTHVKTIEALYTDLVTLANHIGRFGSEVSNKVVELDEADHRLGGSSGTLTKAVYLELAPTLQTVEIDSNNLKITAASIDAGRKVTQVVENTENLLKTLDNKRQTLEGYWKDGGNIEKISQGLEETREKIKEFKSKAAELIDAMLKTQQEVSRL